MPIKARYPGQLTDKTISGFKIIGCLDPNSGFNHNFHVYVHEQLVMDKKAKFSSVEFDPEIKGARGTLSLTNNDFINYQFQDIDLVQVETYITFRTKHRLLVFRYNPEILAEGGASNLITASSTLAANGLQEPAQPYKYGLNGSTEEPVLFFNSAINPSAALLAFHFSSFRTSTNSFVDLAVGLDDKIIKQSEWSNSFSLNGQEVKASKDNLQFLFIDESWGTMLAFPLPSLDKITKVAGQYNKLTHIDFNLFRPVNYYNHYTSDSTEFLNPFYGMGEISGVNSIETGIVVLKNGTGANLQPSIV